jgi:hypothetical protein
MKGLPKYASVMLAAVMMCGMCLSGPLLATTGPVQGPFDGFDGSQPEVNKVEGVASAASKASPDPVYSARLTDIERRLTQLESKAIDAAEAREIAEQVVEEKLAELRLAIKTAAGNQRSETVSLTSGQQTAGIVLGPGETLLGYTDAITGQYHQMQTQPTRYVRVQSYADPIPAWEMPTVEIRAENQPSSNRRLFQFRSNRRASSGSGTCTIVNGVRVCTP